MAPSSFLKPLLDSPDDRWVLRNSRTSLILADRLEPAFESEARRRGLLGRNGLDAGAALIIAPSNGIHTFSMRFAIDAVFVRRDGHVTKICSGLAPWRIGFSWSAFAVVELPATAAVRAGTQVGDVLEIVRSSA